MLATGIGIPIMAALNGALGPRIGSAPAAATILFLVGGLVALAATWLRTAGLALMAAGVFLARQPFR